MSDAVQPSAPSELLAKIVPAKPREVGAIWADVEGDPMFTWDGEQWQPVDPSAPSEPRVLALMRKHGGGQFPLWSHECREVVAYIDVQAARIAELEAERDAAHANNRIYYEAAQSLRADAAIGRWVRSEAGRRSLACEIADAIYPTDFTKDPDANAWAIDMAEDIIERRAALAAAEHQQEAP